MIAGRGLATRNEKSSGVPKRGDALALAAPMQGPESPSTRGSRPSLHDRSLAPLFPEFDGRSPARPAPAGALLTANGPIDLAKPLPGRLAADPARAMGRQGAVLLVNFGAEDASAAHVGALVATTGARLLAPYARTAVLVRAASAPQIAALRRLPGVDAVLPFGPELFVDRRIGQLPVFTAAEAASRTLPLVAGVIPGEDAAAVAGALRAAGASIRAVEAPAGAVAVIRFDLDYDRILAVADSVGGLLRIEEERPFEAADEEMAATTQSGNFFNGRVPLWDAGVDGGGGGLTSPQTVAVTDTGLSYDALHFSQTTTSAGTPGPGHAKVQSYAALPLGDLLTCDGAGSGGSTHGNVVAGIIAGNVSRFGLDLRNNPGWEAGFTAAPADGVARGARIVFQDGQAAVACASGFDTVQPGNLHDRMTEGHSAGARVHNLSFSASLTQAQYTLDAINVDTFLRANRDYLAVVAAGNEGADFNGDGNYEFGSITAPGTAKNALTVGASNYPNEPINPFDPDLALTPGVPNEGVNLLAVFAEGSTGRGPATFTGGVVKPEVMAPGQDVFPNLRVDGAASCTSSDNDNSSSTLGVECILDDDNDGTSYAAAGVSGAAALVRDYFAQGFGPDGAPGGAGVGTSLSGAAVKALLIASADFMRPSPAFRFDLVQPRFDIPDLRGRFNYEQGYGRVQLSNILPLNTEAGTPSGLRVEDQGVSGGLLEGQTFSTTVAVLDPDRELRVALAWMDPPDLSAAGVLVNDLDLEVIDHGPNAVIGGGDDVLYRGNFFTEDQGNFDGRLYLFDSNFPSVPGEDSDGDGLLDESEFSLPVNPAIRNYFDRNSPNEAVMLSPDPNHDGSTVDRQLHAGRLLTVRVTGFQVSSPYETVISPGGDGVLDSSAAGDDQVSGQTINAGPDGVGQSSALDDDVQVVPVGQSAPQRFALVIGGGITTTSVVRLDASRFQCNDLVTPSVLDTTPALSAAGAALALSLEVRDPADAVIDTESNIALSQPDPGNGRFVGQPLAAIDGVTPIDSDGILNVVDGARIIATYADADGPVMTFEAEVACRPQLSVATILGPGVNQNYAVRGGCDAPRRRDPRGVLVGFQNNPYGDLFLDADERLSYSVSFLNQELETDLIDAVATLRAVIPDLNNAADPARLDNTPADSGAQMKVRILNPSRDIGLVPRGTLQAVGFDIEVMPGVAFPDEIEMVFGISARRNGLPVESLTVLRHTLDMDQESFRYSTDFPAGGTEVRAYAGEFADPLDPEIAAETFTFADATSTAFGGGNPLWAIVAAEPKAPWTFDLNNEGFTTARRFDSTPGQSLDLDLNLWHWMNTGECGFQSNAPGQVDGQGGTGGIWHTGTIGLDPPEAARKQVNGRTGFDLGCEDYDAPNDVTTPTNEQVLDVLSSPEFHRVHVNPDGNGYTYTLEFTRFAFNHQLDTADANAIIGWELDPDTTTPDPVDPLDFGWLNLVNSARGFLTGVSQIPYATFDPNSPHDPGTENGVGPQGSGSVGPFYDIGDAGRAPTRRLGEVGGTGFGTIQLRGAGGLPLRNVEEILDGFYGGDTAFEDIFGPNENPNAVPPIRRDHFRAHFSMLVRENANPSLMTLPSYGIGVDDVVVEWLESHPVADAAPCRSLTPAPGVPPPDALGGCGRILWDRSVIYEAEEAAVLTILDADALYGPDGVPGTGDEQAVDSDNDGFLEMTATVFSDVDLAGETIRLVQPAFGSPLYQAVVQFSATTGLNSPVDGVIFMQQNGDGSSPVLITAQYSDLDFGGGEPCPDNPVKATMVTQFVGGNLLFVSAVVSDLSGDGDGLADDLETIRLDITMVSNMLDSAENPVVLEDARVFLSSVDPDIACITDNVAAFGDLSPGLPAANPANDAFEFVVGNVQRSSVNQILRGEFSLGITGHFTDITGERRTVSSFATPQRFELNLDLDIAGSTTAAPDFVENWDSPGDGGDGVNSFTAAAMYPVNDAATVDGSRCQYNDPQAPNPNGGGRSISFCRPWSGHDWHVHLPSNSPSAKAFSGDGSLHMGTHEGGKDSSFDTYTTAQLSQALSPVFNIGLSGGAAVSFRHIVSFADDRTFNVPPGEAADRAVVQAAPADPVSGDIISSWVTLPAFQNNYGNQGTDAFINCKFDPTNDFYDAQAALPHPDSQVLRNTDDVSTEDDYFDPNDPERRLGPSSTCFPAFVFAHMGDYTSGDPFDSGRAFVQGSPGDLGSGIWVESKFSLDAFAGQSVRVRLVFSGLELNGPSGNRWAQFFGNQLGNATRGWMVDDFTASGLVTTPVALVADVKTPPAPTCPEDPDPQTPSNEAACGVAISVPGPDLVSPAPGFLVTLDGGASTLDACVDGFIEFRWRIGGEIVQDWSNDAAFRDNPAFTTGYTLDVRCSVDPECTDTDIVQVSIGGNLREISQGGDQSPLLTVTPLTYRILSGVNGICATTASGSSDDVQVTPAGQAGSECVTAGPNGRLQTLPLDDDVVERHRVTVAWETLDGGIGYDLQRVDINAVEPVPLNADPAATPEGNLPVGRLCRLAQTGDGVGDVLEAGLIPAAGKVFGYLANARRIADAVPGNLGAGLDSASIRRPRPVPPSGSCP